MHRYIERVIEAEIKTICCLVKAAYITPSIAAVIPKTKGYGGNTRVDFFLQIKMMEGKADKFII
jgi:hypothetical protein